MRVVVTGSAGHLGEALVRSWTSSPDEPSADEGETHDAIGLDVLASRFTGYVGSVQDRGLLDRCFDGADVVVHAATLHKPHIDSHSEQDFLDTNVAGTLTVLEAARGAGAAVVFISTTSAFGAVLRTRPDEPARWVTEDLRPVPRNIYGVTKVAAEDLCELHHRQFGLPCLVLRTSRFFPEMDDDPALSTAYDGLNLKVNELLYRRVDLADAVQAVECAVARVRDLGFGRYIISATTPFSRHDVEALGRDAPAVVKSYFTDFAPEYDRRGWTMLPRLDRVYDNARARTELGWAPRLDFREALDRLKRDDDPFSSLTRLVGSKGYHRTSVGERG